MSGVIRTGGVVAAGLVAVALLAEAGWSAGLILNEANAVGPRKWLNNADSVPCECAGGSTCATEDDARRGRILGNGGDWIELVVTTDLLDVPGWKIQWAETDNTMGNADQANGTNIWYGQGNREQGELTFTNDPLWTDLRVGTVITISELGTADGGLDTDTSFDPCAGDWWINICTSESTQYITSVHNINGNSDGCAGAGTVPQGQFNVGNDSWVFRLVNNVGAIQLGPIGEQYQGGPGWLNGTGVNSREAIRLSEHPSAAINNNSFYEDCNSSSFGMPNRWSETAPPPTNSCGRYQDFRTLRSWCACTCARILLNEYNAVSETMYLNGGGATTDSAGQAGTVDTTFGRVLGNGGDWFELLVTDDHVDMRGATLAWEEVDDQESGEITLSNHALWSNLRAGTIVTFIRNTTAQGGRDTNVTYNPLTNDRWININTQDATYIDSTNSTVKGHGFGDFHTSNDGWRLTITAADKTLLSISSGEGSLGFGGRGVGNAETCMMEQNPSTGSKSWDNYNASIRSTFGALNTWKNCPQAPVIIQSVAALPAGLCTARPDIDANGLVNIDDYTEVILGWGACSGLPCLGDVDDDGDVDIDDYTAVILNWTP